MQCTLQNMGKTTVKNQKGKFLHINMVLWALFLWIFLRGQDSGLIVTIQSILFEN